MRTMYDAVTAANIPKTATMVAGYVDKIRLEPWTAADWARFPAAVKVQIVKKASSNFGHVLDVETGDATPTEAPGWVKARRAAGADPTVYCNASLWPAVQAAFVAAKVAHPHYWIARYDGVQQLPTLNGITAVAKQYAGDVAPGIDLSVVADYWPGVDSVPAPGPGSSGSSTKGIDTMDRYTAKATPSNGNVRVLLPGGDQAAIIIRPGAEPVWLGNVFAWGDNNVGVGGNPVPTGQTALRVDHTRKFVLPGALWADVGYSSNSDFVIDTVG